MAEIILAIFVIFLSVLGLSDLLHRMWMLLIRPKKVDKALLILLSDTTAPELITAELEEKRWYGKSYASRIIGVDNGLDEKTAYECYCIQKRAPEFVFLKFEELEKYFRR